MRVLLLLHRYLGIAVGWAMAVWCVSGFVMMYEGYPHLDEADRLRALEPIEWRDCCAFDRIAAELGVAAVETFAVESVVGRPTLRVRLVGGARQAFDLRSGEIIGAFGSEQAASAAMRFAGANDVRRIESVLRDQWTVSSAFSRDRPLWRVSFADGVDVYVSSVTGAVAQVTTLSQRFWNWLGAVPHWFYPTALRQHVQVWSQTVIWLSLIGAFLTVIGVYIGVVHWRAMRGTKWSPYRGAALWHHLSGLFFGVLTLTWVGSGLVSMNPWGFGDVDEQAERDQVRGVWLDAAQIVAALRPLAANALADVRMSDIVSVQSAPFDGRLYLLLHGAQTRRVTTPALTPAVVAEADIARVSQSFAKDARVDLLKKGDAYYYSGHEQRVLPAYRVIASDSERTRYYFDALSGDLVAKFDGQARTHRWLFEGLHRLDFTPLLRNTLWRDVLMLPLLLGVTIVCFTGAYLGWRRLLRSSRRHD